MEKTSISSIALGVIVIILGSCAEYSLETPVGENILFIETSEEANAFSSVNDWDIGDWDYAFNIVEHKPFKGNKAARFEIQEDQELVADGVRSEVTIVKGSDGDVGRESWYSFAVYFPSDGYEYDIEREIINQWYQDTSPATSLRTAKNQIYLESGNSEDTRIEYPIAPITKDVWNTFVFHFIHSYDEDGLIEVWHNGVKKLTIHGGNMYDTILPKWKIGLYKAAFKYHTSEVSRRVIYFDNIKVGDQSSNYRTMIP